MGYSMYELRLTLVPSWVVKYNSKAVLTKLTRFEIHSESGPAPCVNNLLAFAALPSLKELSASKSSGPTEELSVLIPASGVIKLDLCDSALNSETLCSLLRSCPKL